MNSAGNPSIPQAAPQTCCPVVELRQYTLRPGQRDILIELFDREFVETQEACGMKIIGQFRDLDRPDCFVWLRGFSDMVSRARGLADFYGGPVWKAHRDAANATMIDSDNVLLLRPVSDSGEFKVRHDARANPGPGAAAGRVIGATIHYFDSAVEQEFNHAFEQIVRPSAESLGATIVGCFLTETAENTFPGLPVREGEHVFVWFSRLSDEATFYKLRARLIESTFPRLRNQTGLTVRHPPELLGLLPTARSAL
jgi:NIPSNAP